jgi:uncharacterized membrane protein YqjE
MPGRLEDGSVMTRELKKLADATARLVKQHVDLAKVELQEEAKRMAADAAVAAIAVPFLLTAQLLLSAALALWIAEALGGPWAFAIVGGANLVAGAALAIVGLRKLQKDARDPLPATAAEVGRNRELLRGLRVPGSATGVVTSSGSKASLPRS